MGIKREIAIGERRIICGMLVECVEDDKNSFFDACNACAFFPPECAEYCKIYYCGANLRKDGRNVHFAEIIDK